MRVSNLSQEHLRSIRRLSPEASMAVLKSAFWVGYTQALRDELQERQIDTAEKEAEGER